MKMRVACQFIISVVFAGAACSQSARAEGSSARFHFAPNVWKAEGAPKPASRAVEPMHSVRSGSVPRSASFLGLNPQLLSKPAPQVPLPQIEVASIVPQVAPQVAVPKAEFKTAFGKPVGSTSAPIVANAPVTTGVHPQAATAKSLPKATYTRSRGSHPSLRSDKSVHAQLAKIPTKATPAGNQGVVASAGKGIESYGKNLGYVPGTYLPAATEGGVVTQTDVWGRLLRH
ncbi:MAG: hypothetical protein HY711_07495 [Candidatus Melainabacteria bacterium]|nr:hypothetical protein [Candidatus Melainabacteria bacterium]